MKRKVLCIADFLPPRNTSRADQVRWVAPTQRYGACSAVSGGCDARSPSGVRGAWLRLRGWTVPGIEFEPGSDLHRGKGDAVRNWEAPPEPHRVTARTRRHPDAVRSRGVTQIHAEGPTPQIDANSRRNNPRNPRTGSSVSSRDGKASFWLSFPRPSLPVERSNCLGIETMPRSLVPSTRR